MKNKNGRLTLEYMVYIIIGIVVLVYVLAAFLLPEGLLNRFSVSDAKKWIPGKDSIDVIELESSEVFDSFFDNFINILESAKIDDEKCLIRYGKVDDFGDFQMELSNSGSEVLLRKLTDRGQALSQQTVEGINFCLIDPQPFFDNYLRDEICTNNCQQDFTEPTSIIFTEDTIEDVDLEDGGLMYKPTKDKVCFFPTHDFGATWWNPISWIINIGCEANEGTIDDDCISRLQDIIGVCEPTPPPEETTT